MDPREQQIDELALDACRWFLDHANPRTGLVRDRAPNLDLSKPATRQASLGATGFYLSLLPEFSRRLLITQQQAADRARVTLQFVVAHVEHVSGILPHFVDWETGARWGNSEYSTLDTAIFLNGCMVAGQACPAVRVWADRLIDRVDWMRLWTTKDTSHPSLLSYGYSGKDRTILSASVNVRSAENLMPCVLAAGSPTYPLKNDCWYHARIMPAADAPAAGPSTAPPVDSYAALRTRCLNPNHPLFTSEYGLVWANLRGLHDADAIDLEENARVAALMNRAFCREIAARRFQTYQESNGGWWGLSAGDGPHDYVAPGPVDGDPDGTVWPTAALASVGWIQDQLLGDLARWQQSKIWPRVRGKYGLAPFSLDKHWIGNDLIGIDLGCFACAWANVCIGQIHHLWMQHPAARAGIQHLEFSHA